MSWTLRDYQACAVDFLCERLLAGEPRTLLAGPCGSGKSLVEIAVRRRLGAGCWLVTPRLEIARGLLAKEGADVRTAAALVRSCWERRVVTPIRFLNALVRGDVRDVRWLLLDEGHHAQARSWIDLQALCGGPPAALLTATPYRGTSRSTAQFLAEWGEPTWMVTLAQAAARGDVAVPRFEVLPLVDDDEVEVTASGEFDVRSTVSAYGSRLEDLAERSMRWILPDGSWDRSTVYALPSTACARDLAAALLRRGAAASVVTAATRRHERDAAYALLVGRAACLCQVAVLGEGVDLPVRRLVDASPRQSPVAWMQVVGRATRPVDPGEAPPEVWVTNRNLQRHAYLFEGLLPPSALAAAVDAFGGLGRRAGGRALGLEAVGRFRAAEVRALDGCVCLLYSLVDARGGRMREYAAFVHPAAADPVWAERVHGARPDGTRDWGRWTRCAAPADLRGFGSQAPRDPTEKMMAFWRRSARGRGLDPEQRVTRKNFAALPLLLDLGIRLRIPEGAP